MPSLWRFDVSGQDPSLILEHTAISLKNPLRYTNTQGIKTLYHAVNYEITSNRS